MNSPYINKLSKKVWTILGLNPGPFTLQGTNTYLVGEGQSRILIDTGANMKGYKELLKYNKCKIQQTILTHNHMDHVGGIKDILEIQSNCKFYKYGYYPEDQILEEKYGFKYEKQQLQENQIIQGDDFTIQVIATPGHCDDHICFYLREEKTLFTGDFILSGSSNVIRDLKKQMNSLQKSLQLDIENILSSHGPPILGKQQAQKTILENIKHRNMREEQIIGALQKLQQSTIYQIREIVYPGLKESLINGALKNIIVHLNKLIDDGIKARLRSNKSAVQCIKINSLSKNYDGLIYSGQLPANDTEPNDYFQFIFYGAKGKKDHSELTDIPTIIWLNGGPGKSSQIGNFMENGPLYINQGKKNKFSFKKNKNALTNNYNVIYIDQPIGVGISHRKDNTRIPKNQEEIANQLYFGLKSLFEEGGCFKKNSINQLKTPFFIFGESYAGKFALSLGKKVQEEKLFNLKGIGLFSGMISPYNVIKSIPEYSFKNKIINEKEYDEAQKFSQQITKSLDDGPKDEKEWLSLFKDFGTLINKCIKGGIQVNNINQKKKINYDVLNSFLNSDYGQETFHLQLDKEFKDLDYAVNSALQGDFLKEDCVNKLEWLLDQGIHINIFSGKLDLISNHIAAENLVQQLKWKHSKEFQETEIFDNKKIQEIKHENLAFTELYDVGHYIPIDNPVLANEISQKFIEWSLK